MTHPVSQAIVDLRAYAQNLRAIRAMIAGACQLMPVLKANAYGHGAVPIARAAFANGANMVAVATVDEGIELRNAGIEAPILVTVQPLPDAAAATVEYDLRLVISNIEFARRVGELARKANKVVPIHAKIDTGMGRQGFASERAVEDLSALTRISHIDIEGILTHFPSAEDTSDMTTATQVRAFKKLLGHVGRQGIPYEIAHAANSAGIVCAPASHFDLVRPGILTYGVWPTPAPPSPCPVKPVLRWETRIVLVREIEQGATIGYGKKYRANARMRTALLPIGYADGYKYALANKGDVLIRGKRCRVLGAVSMDQIVVDVTALSDVAVGEKATLIGSDGSETITAAELAERAQTISYDILTGIGPRVVRTYIE